MENSCFYCVCYGILYNRVRERKPAETTSQLTGFSSFNPIFLRIIIAGHHLVNDD